LQAGLYSFGFSVHGESEAAIPHFRLSRRVPVRQVTERATLARAPKFAAQVRQPCTASLPTLVHRGRKLRPRKERAVTAGYCGAA